MQIPVRVTFNDMERDAAAEASIEKWLAKLERVYDRIIRCEVVVEAPHRRHRKGWRYHVRVRLTVPQGDLVVADDPGPARSHEDLGVALRDAFQAARRQLEDHVRVLRGDVKRVREGAGHGRVADLDVEREWGFLDTGDGRRVYFHRNSVIGGIQQLSVGDEVRFTEEAGEEGPQASTVEPIGAHGRHELPRT